MLRYSKGDLWFNGESNFLMVSWFSCWLVFAQRRMKLNAKSINSFFRLIFTEQNSRIWFITLQTLSKSRHDATIWITRSAREFSFQSRFEATSWLKWVFCESLLAVFRCERRLSVKWRVFRRLCNWVMSCFNSTRVVAVEVSFIKPDYLCLLCPANKLQIQPRSWRIGSSPCRGALVAWMVDIDKQRWSSTHACEVYTIRTLHCMDDGLQTSLCKAEALLS